MYGKKKYFFTGILVAVVFLLIHIFFVDNIESGNLPAALVLSGVDRETLSKQITAHFESLVHEQQSSKFDSAGFLYQTTYVDIDNDGRKDLIILTNSESTCGTGGCLSGIFLQQNDKAFEVLEFPHAVKSIEVLDTYTNNMRDLRVNNDETSRMVWNGRQYELESI